ncbi:MAG: hypothetical protein A2750_04305 [Candidatus Yanofskybacteria bacterium RIFCSPHIGHO2_01_FULL_45_42]|uniref:TVP38/TMEM64 family membrane protein n=2 Tax=Candidatus Yanofskyibacteriota TaxID=1752733 RepID=A0A1F8FK42_9BACT|nr:MAG: hypothetical protein A2750_04305 [Candidatus Yanofskybacteria bacterium RIFCSPHIGHO2_01_FULL_45_42]OGN13484.1 MAG: hypothetical protein A3J47_03960 [Candidatus Yanofskybacteria bacterium RIFCSPHIGHO2_02_FULL_43_22]
MLRIANKMTKFFKENWIHLVRVVLILFVIILALWASWAIKDSDFVSGIVKQFGYAGIFLIAVVSGFNLVIPVPAISFLPIFLASGLNVLAVVSIIAAGMTLADFVGYLLGKAGRYMALSAFERRVINKFERFKDKLHWSPALALFLYASFVPLPNEVIVLPMAFLGYRFTHIFFPVFFGNMVFNSLYAAGVVNILKLIG